MKFEWPAGTRHDVEMVRDDGLHVESALQHARHFVPGLEHLTTVDAFENQSLEDDIVPVDGHVARWDAQDGDLAAMVHRTQHIAECLRVT